MGEMVVKDQSVAEAMEKLSAAGFYQAAEKLKRQRQALTKGTSTYEKAKVAFSNCVYITEKQVSRFDFYLRSQNKLRKSTPISEFRDIPPQDVVDAVQRAQGLKCFDYFTVMTVVNDPDPIIFGHIQGVGEWFYIAQWGDDVNIFDILEK